MHAQDHFVDLDPPAAAALYLSVLDHRSWHSEEELQWAVERIRTDFDALATLMLLYRRTVLEAAAADGHDPAERRAWALRMAADLSQGFECAAAAQTTANGRRELTAAKALRSLRAVRRRPVQVVAGVVVTQLVETALANEAPGIMALSLVGPVNLGLVLAFLQLGLTAWSVLWYARYGKTSLDPQIKRHRVAFTSLENR
jgi:hypothetical protein